jgi:hypothetical protein
MKFRYCFFSSFTLIGLCAYAQPNQTNQAAVVTLVGDSDNGALGNGTNDPHDFIQSNPYSENKAPQMQQEMTQQGNIEPTLENGFHARFELNSPKSEEPLLVAGINTSGGSTSHSAGGATSVGKTKRHAPSMTERSFNVKKRLNSWLPKRKKRYHPHLCGRF